MIFRDATFLKRFLSINYSKRLKTGIKVKCCRSLRICCLAARGAVRHRGCQDYLQYHARHVSTRVHVCSHRRSTVQGASIMQFDLRGDAE